MLLHVFFVYFWFGVKHDLMWDSLRPCISLSSTATYLCVILWGQERYLIIGQHSPQWETQSGRVQFPRVTNGPRIINHWQKTAATWNTFRHVTRCCRSSWEIPQHCEMRMCECILPQMELIRAVGLKLSTKSDIRLPNSWKKKKNEEQLITNPHPHYNNQPTLGVWKSVLPSVTAHPPDTASWSQSQRSTRAADKRCGPVCTPPPSHKKINHNQETLEVSSPVCPAVDSNVLLVLRAAAEPQPSSRSLGPSESCPTRPSADPSHPDKHT